MIKNSISANTTDTQLLYLEVQDYNATNDLWIFGGEPVYIDNACVGSVSCSGFDFVRNKLICVSFVTANHSSLEKDQLFYICVSGKQFKVKSI